MKSKALAPETKAKIIYIIALVVFIISAYMTIEFIQSSKIRAAASLLCVISMFAIVKAVRLKRTLK
jgi:uncharacterized membrane protein